FEFNCRFSWRRLQKRRPPSIPGVLHIPYPALLVATVLHLIPFPCGVRTTAKACPVGVRQESSCPGTGFAQAYPLFTKFLGKLTLVGTLNRSLRQPGAR